MQLYENRIINGLLKSPLALGSPEAAAALLASDIVIMADINRVSVKDLWPCIWALATVLERQFSGTIYINCGLSESLPSPAAFSPKIIFTQDTPENAIQIGLGKQPDRGKHIISGDTRGAHISFGTMLPMTECAHPISCFALAGHLGFAALAIACGIPPFHEDFTTNSLALPFSINDQRLSGEEEFAFIGLGHLGQAYLALMYFLLETPVNNKLLLLDRDYFANPNRSTQILLDSYNSWEGEPKADYLAAKFSELGFLNVRSQMVQLDWNWKRPTDHPCLALLGLDNFDTRRMVASLDYEWIFEAGIGTSFLQPRITWHSSAPSEKLKSQFPRDADKAPPEPTTSFGKELKENTLGGCGWVTFNNISASAPSMGILASAYVWSEILTYLAGKREPVKGGAYLWSALLPFYTSPI